ncbi:unnamed protein product [Brassica oleracea]
MLQNLTADDVKEPVAVSAVDVIVSSLDMLERYEKKMVFLYQFLSSTKEDGEISLVVAFGEEGKR